MTAWSGIGYYECLTRQDIEDNIQNGTFTRLSTFTVDNKLVTKAEVSAYISFTPNASFNAKTSDQIIIKGDINAGGITPPPTPTPTPASFPNRYYVRKLNADCTLTSTYLYADLGTGITPPTVNQYVTLSTNAGCWQVVSIDQSNSVTDTINAVYPTSCTCTSPLLTVSYGTTGFQTCLGVPSAYQTLTISGVYLTDNIIITGPSQLEFSLNPTTNYVASLTLTPSSGTVSQTTVYFRITGAYTYAPTWLTINITSTGASPLNPSSAAAYTIASPSITSTTPGSRVGTGTVTLSATVTTSATVDWYAASTGGTALATGTLSFTTPSISTTTTYYVQARDTSGNNCTPASSTRTAVVATITPPPVPAPLIGTLGTSIVFWDTLGTDISGFPTVNYNGINEPTNNPFIPLIGTMPINSGTPFLSYYYFNEYQPTYSGGRYLTWTAGTYLKNAPAQSSKLFTLMWYGTLPQGTGVDNSSNYYKLWCKDSNSFGWDIIWEPVPARFTFRRQIFSDKYISYTWENSNFNLYTFVFLDSSIILNINGVQRDTVSPNLIEFGTVSTDLNFGYGYTNNDAIFYKGQVSQVLMYNNALTQSQISSIYQYFSGNTPTSTSTNTGGSTNSTGTGTFFTLY